MTQHVGIPTEPGAKGEFIINLSTTYKGGYKLK